MERTSGDEWAAEHTRRRFHTALGQNLLGIRDHPGIGADLVEAAMLSPSVQNRIGALNVLDAWDPQHWTTLHHERLSTMASTDPHDDVRNRAVELRQRPTDRS